MVVSFHTPHPTYRKYAEQLAMSCMDLGLHYTILPRPDLGSWVKNCGQKAAFLRDLMSLNRSPLLWIDADARCASPPTLFDEPKFSFAVGVRKPRGPGQRTVNAVGRGIVKAPDNWPDDVPLVFFNSGTIYLGVDALVDEMLSRWVELTEADPHAWDQWTLQQAWSDFQPLHHWLPKEYVDIRGRTKNPVIVHGLASVELKVDRS